MDGIVGSHVTLVLTDNRSFPLINLDTSETFAPLCQLWSNADDLSTLGHLPSQATHAQRSSAELWSLYAMSDNVQLAAEIITWSERMVAGPQHDIAIAESEVRAACLSGGFKAQELTLDIGA